MFLLPREVTETLFDFFNVVTSSTESFMIRTGFSFARRAVTVVLCDPSSLS